MSVFILPGVFVRIQQLESETAPRPLPLESGFDPIRAYEVLGLHAPSESAEAYLILRNDRDELWFISNRHVRVVDHVSLVNAVREGLPTKNGHFTPTG
jgi:hypothetical protein